MKFLTSTFTLIIFFLINFSSFAQVDEKIFNEYLNEFYKDKNVPSISAAIEENGNIIWKGTRGHADLENNTLTNTTSLYRIASISKSITAVAVMQLVEKGKISLFDNVKKYLPEYKKAKYNFTIKQLLNHTSGIRGYNDGEFDSKYSYSSIHEVVGALSKDTLQFKPGTKYLYSTLAYNLLADIVEKVSGKNFVEYCKENIFIPAGMTHTCADYQKEIIKFRVHGYQRRKDKSFENSPLADLSIKIPGGGFLSNPTDLMKFAINILNGKLIKKSTLKQMLEPSITSDGVKRNYGLGFGFGTDKSGHFFFDHQGGGTGFVSHLIIYPDLNIAAVYLVNLKTNDFGDPANDLINLYLRNCKNHNGAKK